MSMLHLQQPSIVILTLSPDQVPGKEEMVVGAEIGNEAL
jgi:hypothetical protein